jgi:putative transcriptional regulator
VLIAHHDEEGAVGVVLNRPSESTVWEAVPPLGRLVGPEERLYVGGPVQPQAAVLLAEFKRPEDAEVLAFGRIGFVTGDVDTGSVEGLSRVRIFAGYAGWGAGQLEAEMEQDSWIVEPARPQDVFTEEPEQLWETVLRRKGGKFALMQTMPIDPSMN